MGTIVEAQVPASEFALGDTVTAVPDASFETVRTVTAGTDQPIPFLWAATADFDRLDEALRDDDSTDEVTRLVRDGNHVLYRISWQARVRALGHFVAAEDGTLLDARLHGETWKLRVLFPEKAAMSSFYDTCRSYGVDIDVSRVNGLESVVRHGGTRLSAEQYEALSEALDADYYGVPRGSTLVELSDRLDVSHQAVSERLRRAHQSLIESSLHDGLTPDEPHP
ncbi:bacterio-opsin activator domain-containing protein (plasmid) [Halorientalis pallida]|uniref:helix-turn-helix domain-containing protein n=1 Tax=Halorientalis pallida TaxID=2479928 RepID=UPI003C700330